MKLNLKVEDQSIFKPRKLNSTLVGCLFLSEKLTWRFVPLKPRIMHVVLFIRSRSCGVNRVNLP